MQFTRRYTHRGLSRFSFQHNTLQLATGMQKEHIPPYLHCSTLISERRQIGDNILTDVSTGGSCTGNTHQDLVFLQMSHSLIPCYIYEVLSSSNSLLMNISQRRDENWTSLSNAYNFLNVETVFRMAYPTLIGVFLQPWNRIWDKWNVCNMNGTQLVYFRWKVSHLYYEQEQRLILHALL